MWSCATTDTAQAQRSYLTAARLSVAKTSAFHKTFTETSFLKSLSMRSIISTVELFLQSVANDDIKLNKIQRISVKSDLESDLLSEF